MRLTSMNRLFTAAASVLIALPLAAQSAAPPNTGNAFKDTSPIKPPAGAKVAVFEFEDMECPACANAFPIVHQAIAQYKIPLVRHDFPLGPSHPWSFDAAVYARFLQDTISPQVADEYRGAVFAGQTGIASKDDLLKFTQRFFQKKGGQMPFVVDPTGKLAAEVKADRALGDRVGLTQTPTIFVVSNQGWVQVTNPNVLFQTIEQIQAKVAAAEAGAAKKKTVAAR
jgi:protein-disulfide isomerase